jgi:polysaccharide biosynthesis/export protein
MFYTIHPGVPSRRAVAHRVPLHAGVAFYYAVVMLLIGGPTGHAQAPNRIGSSSALTESANLPPQKIGVDDLIGVSVYDAPELTRTVRVSGEGTIRLPLLKQKLKAGGLLPSELEAVIVAALRDENVFVEPIVTVTVVEYRSRPVKVVGAVKAPLTFQVAGATTLLDALSLAGGLSDSAGPEILISGPHLGAGQNPPPLRRRVQVKDLIEGTTPDLNIRLEGGEEIRVPDAGRVYVVGNVRKPGVFPIRDASHTSVLKVLALSEGLAPFATKMAYIYRQEGAAGGKTQLPVELSKIMQRKAPDVPLVANDILYIPDNKGSRGVASTLEKVLALGGIMGAAAIYTAR